MKINFAVALILAACLWLPACDGANNGEGQKSAVVDLGRLMRESAPGRDGLKFIEAQQKEMQDQLDAIQDRLEKNPQDEAAMQELQKVYASSQQRIQAEGQNVAAQILDVVQRALNNYRAQNGYAYILMTDSLASFDPSLDITSAVMAEVDKQKVEFTSLGQEAAQATPATEKAPSASDGPDGKKGLSPEKAPAAPAK